MGGASALPVLNLRNPTDVTLTYIYRVAGGEKGRVLLYEIAALVEGREVDTWKLAQELHFHPLGRVPTSSRLVIGADEVPAGAVTFRVTPVGFFHKGEPITGTL